MYLHSSICVYIYVCMYVGFHVNNQYGANSTIIHAHINKHVYKFSENYLNSLTKKEVLQYIFKLKSTTNIVWSSLK